MPTAVLSKTRTLGVCLPSNDLSFVDINQAKAFVHAAHPIWLIPGQLLDKNKPVVPRYYTSDIAN